MDSILTSACHKYKNTGTYTYYVSEHAMQQFMTMRVIHAVMEAYHICGKPIQGLTQWVPKQVDGNTLDDGELVYGSCEEDLYYEI